MQANILSLHTPLTSWAGLDKKARHCNGGNKYIFVELSDLKGFGYDLSDTQDGLTCWGYGIYILW